MDALRKAGDSCGARIEVRASGVPVGLGEPLFDKLDADIAYAMMGINAVKGVEIGDGFGVVAQRGSEHGDELTPEGFASNHAGGVLGGISTGQDLVVRAGHQAHQFDPHCPRPASTAPGQPTTVADLRPPRPLRGHPRHAHRRGAAGPGGDGPCLRHRAQCGDVQLPLPPIAGAITAPGLDPPARHGLPGCARFGALSFCLLRGHRAVQPLCAAVVPEPGLSTLAIGSIASLQSWTRIVAPYAWSWLGDHGGRAHRTDPPGRRAALLAALGLLGVRGAVPVALVTACCSWPTAAWCRCTKPRWRIC
jgi:hypothetical protein